MHAFPKDEGLEERFVDDFVDSCGKGDFNQCTNCAVIYCIACSPAPHYDTFCSEGCESEFVYFDESRELRGIK